MLTLKDSLKTCGAYNMTHDYIGFTSVRMRGFAIQLTGRKLFANSQKSSTPAWSMLFIKDENSFVFKLLTNFVKSLENQ